VAAGTLDATANVAGGGAQTDVVPLNNEAHATTIVALQVKSQPALTGHASAGGPAGAPILDEATLAGGFQASGTITFTLHGPGDATCSGAPLAASTATASGDDTYASEAYTPTLPGTYRWVVAYSGDVSNEAEGPTTCADPDQDVVVTKAVPALSTQAGPATPAGNAIGSVAVLDGGVDAGGSLTIRVYGPDDASCTTALATTTSPARP